MKPKEDPKTVLAAREVTPTAPLPKQPFVEPKLTWIEPELRQQGTLNATAQTGGFFGSFSP
ncbi:MAG: hypothetical protein R2932_09520 [Caldilineaceae bacterium]